MNNSKHLLSLLQNNFRTVHVIFGAEWPDAPSVPEAPIILDYRAENAPWANKPAQARVPGEARAKRSDERAQAPAYPQAEPVHRSYVYKCHNDLAVEVGSSAVVIDDNGRLRLVTVVKVDEFADIDLNADFSYKWIVDVVDTKLYSDLIEKEQKFSRLVTEAQRVKMREETLESFKSVLPKGGEAARLFNEAFDLFGSSSKPNDAAE